MFTRVVQGKRPRPLALLAIFGAVIVAGLFAAVALALVNDTHVGASCDIQVANKSGTALCTTTAGAKVRYLGDSNQTFGSSGTGTFNPFVRLQGSPTEAGFNTDGAVELQTKTGTWTHSILVSEIPVRTEDSCVDCWELFVDVNDGNNNKPISLNDLEIWFTEDPDLVGYRFAGDPVYDFEGTILINDVNQGSGRGDVRYMIPLTGITIPPNCNYGNTLCETYFVLYSSWGETSGFPSDGGFEEWKVKVYPPPNTIATQVMNTNGTTDPANDTAIADGGQVSVGTAVYDTATITGETADAGGTVSYYRKLQAGGGTGDCTAGTLIGSAVTVTNGAVPPSATITLSTAGTYEFWAVYTGDVNNNSSTSPCGSETVVVGQNVPDPATTPVVNIKDTITVTGFAPPATTVPVLVGLYSDAGCLTQIGTDTSFTVPSGGGTVTGETSFVAVTSGDYFFKISYAGDANNTAFSDCTEKVDVTITSLP